MYAITTPANLDLQVREYGRLHDAVNKANALALEHTAEFEVVDTESQTVAHVATYVQGRHFHPFERVETPKFSAPHIEGYRPAYNRKRIEAVVYRSLDERSWLVRDGRTGGTRVCGNTVESRQLLTAMKNGLTL